MSKPSYINITDETDSKCQNLRKVTEIEIFHNHSMSKPLQSNASKFMINTIKPGLSSF